ncbi:MAG: Eco57I restriction-modification methylase domain-containing protein [Ktedonobacteraceae bacterium]
MDIRQLHEEAFDVEAVTKRFFEEYKVLFRILEIDLRKQTDDAAWAHDYALQFLNRCMFLYFIQRKGWLGGDKEFLRSFWDSYKKTDHEKDEFFENWLKVLFFEAFNNRFHGGHRYFPENIQNILATAPYLNGGLFSQNKLDTGHTFAITDARFEQVYTFFERFNFTISEDSPLDQEVAVDPEMIGKVYESLVNVSTEADERGDAGIFYTPRTEIDLMCRLAVVDYLSNHLGQDKRNVLYDAVFALEPNEKSSADDALTVMGLWEPLSELLRDITVVDPACGSGSFLVGMLYVLDDLQDRVNQHFYDQEDPYTRKKRIIGQSLYGVDVMEWAAHIAELRLWLALIIDAEISHPEDLHVRVDPLLPHLSFKVRFGDSLVQEIGGINMSHTKTNKDLSPALKRRLTDLKTDKLNYYHNYASRHPKSKDQLEQDELQFFREILDDRIQSKQEEKKKLLRQIEGPAEQQMSLVDTTIGHSPQRNIEKAEQQRRLGELESELGNLKIARAGLTTPKDVPFVWDIAFVEVFAGGKHGFDIVIGNPPYVRQEKIAAPRQRGNEVARETQKETYKTKLARSVYSAFPDFFGYKEAKDTAAHKIDAKSDLYIYFYFYSLGLLNPKGSFCFITSNSWLDVGYGADLQEFLLRYCRVKMILDNQVRRSFATADVNTVITLFSAPSERPGTEELNNIARFVMFIVTFERVLSSDIFRQIEKTQERTVTPEYRVYPISQRTLLEEGFKQPVAEEDTSIPIDTSKRFTSRPLVKEAHAAYTANKWGGRYLRAPDIYWTILEKGKGKLVRLGDIADVRFGIKTGANEFFYLDTDKAQQWRIEEEFLQPAIKSPRECKSILIDSSTLKSRLFLCHKTKEELRGTAALEYIKWGESQAFHKRPSCAGRPRWWNLGVRRSPYLGFNYLIDSTAKTLYAPDGCYFSDNFQEVNVSAPFVLPLCASLNSTVFQLMVNVAGRSNFGDGLLKIQTYEVSDLLCLDPTTIDFKSSEIFSSTFWDVLHPSPDRRTLDDIIFEALNLTQGEREAVYEGVIELVETRLEKAKSLKVSQERRKRLEAVDKTLGIWIGLPEEEHEDEVESHYA